MHSIHITTNGLRKEVGIAYTLRQAEHIAHNYLRGGAPVVEIYKERYDSMPELVSVMSLPRARVRGCRTP